MLAKRKDQARATDARAVIDAIASILMKDIEKLTALEEKPRG